MPTDLDPGACPRNIRLVLVFDRNAKGGPSVIDDLKEDVREQSLVARKQIGQRAHHADTVFGGASSTCLMVHKVPFAPGPFRTGGAERRPRSPSPTPP